MADIETGYWTDRETAEILLLDQRSIRSRAGQKTDEHGASRAPADRGRGFVPPWTTTDGCRQAKHIISTGDTCLHHLHLFLEQLHPPSFFFVILLPPAFQVLPQVQTVAEGAGFFFTASAVGLIEIPLSQSSHVMCELNRWTADINWWITEIMNQGRGESLLWELKAESETGSFSDQFLLSASQAEVVWI